MPATSIIMVYGAPTPSAPRPSSPTPPPLPPPLLPPLPLPPLAPGLEPKKKLPPPPPPPDDCEGPHTARARASTAAVADVATRAAATAAVGGVDAEHVAPTAAAAAAEASNGAAAGAAGVVGGARAASCPDDTGAIHVCVHGMIEAIAELRKQDAARALQRSTAAADVTPTSAPAPTAAALAAAAASPAPATAVAAKPAKPTKRYQAVGWKPGTVYKIPFQEEENQKKLTRVVDAEALERIGNYNLGKLKKNKLAVNFADIGREHFGMSNRAQGKSSGLWDVWRFSKKTMLKPHEYWQEQLKLKPLEYWLEQLQRQTSDPLVVKPPNQALVAAPSPNQALVAAPPPNQARWWPRRRPTRRWWPRCRPTRRWRPRRYPTTSFIRCCSLASTS
jgi:hypothetical protein